ncbi:MAG TPA: ABC transporter permease subunit [Candidatus Faecalibacterium faecipullorum]|uniref:ABC transporter permease subunit n=1 Tax=Candidatus Faecalibacterium faecipullorum TaxID=2838578 RepID=A0A9D2S6X2_9FIRM|nr:ABC transporter permease subunit [Candidatus Faecalibacterium faecipullorum]
MSKKQAASKALLPKEPLAARIKKDLRNNYLLYLLMVPGFLLLVLFKIGPVGAMAIAFEDYSPALGVFGSKFVGFDQFIRIFNDPYIWKITGNTIILAFLSVVVVFPIPIIFALFLNEIKVKWIRSTVQSLSFLPYFISAAVMVSILYTLLSPSSGLVNAIIVRLGGEPVNFMAQAGWFRPLYVLLEIWQTFGYSAIIYIAAMMNIDPTLYEAAEIDGATRWTKIWRVTLPCLMPSIITMLIISVGNIFTVNLDRILLMYNTGTYETADVLQTYVYRIAFQSTGFPDYSYGTAVNLVKSIIAFILVMAVNKIADKVADSRFF